MVYFLELLLQVRPDPYKENLLKLLEQTGYSASEVRAVIEIAAC